MTAGFTARSIGKGPDFSHAHPPARPDQLSPRSSSISLLSSSESDDAPPSPSRSLSPEQPAPVTPPPCISTGRIVTNATLIIEELSDFSDCDHERLGVVRPIAIEYAESDSSRSRSRNPPEMDQAFMNTLGNLNCSDNSDETDYDETEYQDFLKKQREAKRRKRMTSGSIGKRTISESIGSDTDLEDLKPFLGADEVGSSARRLRRKVGDRRSLLFQDPPPERIDELDEPESSDDDIQISETLARELPYYQYVSMEIDSP